LVSLDYQNYLQEFIKINKISDAKQITYSMITNFERKILDEHSYYFSIQAGKALRNFLKYWNIDINKQSMDIQTRNNIIGLMNKEKLLKELMSELGKKSWEARKKKYGGSKKARDVFDKARSAFRKDLSTVK
jgi:hypothetical protein